MSDAPATAYAGVKVSPDPGIPLVLETMEVTERLGRPFLIVLDVTSGKPKSDLQSMLGSSATIAMQHQGKAPRAFNGIVARMGYAGLTGGAYRYRMELRPWIWLLSRGHDCRIFSQKSAWDIITGIFRDHGFTDFQDKRQNQSGDTVLDYCVQYRETTLDFVTRLMEQFGLYYYVTHGDGTHTLVFADDPNSHTVAPLPLPYQFDSTGRHGADDHIWGWFADAEIQPGSYTLRDYNFTTPAADLTAQSQTSLHAGKIGDAVYDYPGLYDTAADGQKSATIRMQGFDAGRQVFGGTSNSRQLGAGDKFTLSQFPDKTVNGDYLIIESSCTLGSSETRSFQDQGDIIDTYQCVLKAVPGAQPFRLAAITPRPIIRGPQTAKVTGASGDEVTTDQYGRIKVQFHWDRLGKNDENSSCWIRVAQSWAGPGWGAMFIPRVGQEVVVEFLEGNPDRPIVTGCVYNATNTTPYPLPGKKVVSTVKSNSSLGGGGYNEFRFDDTKGSEEVFLQAQKDLTVTILHNQTVKITQDDTKTVSQGNRAVTVSAGNDSLTVSAGDHKIDISAGGSTITAAQSISLVVGSSSIKLDPSGVTISAAQITLTAQQAFSASGTTAQVSGQASLDLEGGASATLKAAMVAIN